MAINLFEKALAIDPETHNVAKYLGEAKSQVNLP